MTNVVILDFKPLRKGALRGFAKIQAGKLIINDAPILTSHGRSWCGFPGKVQFDAQTGQIRKGPDGKPAYAKVLEWADKPAGDRFSESVIAALIQSHGEAVLDDA